MTDTADGLIRLSVMHGLFRREGGKGPSAGPLSQAVRPPIDPEAYGRLFGHLAAGVSIVTVGRGPDRHGTVARFVAPLSSNPPSLILGLGPDASTRSAIVAERGFAVSILNASQKRIADRFQGRRGEIGAERYRDAEWREGANGAALLVGALTAIECELEEVIDRHAQMLIVARIRALHPGTNEAALIRWRGDYERLGWMRDELEAGMGLRAF